MIFKTDGPNIIVGGLGYDALRYQERELHSECFIKKLKSYKFLTARDSVKTNEFSYFCCRCKYERPGENMCKTCYAWEYYEKEEQCDQCCWNLMIYPVPQIQKDHIIENKVSTEICLECLRE